MLLKTRARARARLSVCWSHQMRHRKTYHWHLIGCTHYQRARLTNQPKQKLSLRNHPLDSHFSHIRHHWKTIVRWVSWYQEFNNNNNNKYYLNKRLATCVVCTMHSENIGISRLHIQFTWLSSLMWKLTPGPLFVAFIYNYTIMLHYSGIHGTWTDFWLNRLRFHCTRHIIIVRNWDSTRIASIFEFSNFFLPPSAYYLRHAHIRIGGCVAGRNVFGLVTFPPRFRAGQKCNNFISGLLTLGWHVIATLQLAVAVGASSISFCFAYSCVCVLGGLSLFVLLL